MIASERLYRKMGGRLLLNCFLCVIIFSAAQIVAQSAAQVAPGMPDATSVQSSATLPVLWQTAARQSNSSNRSKSATSSQSAQAPTEETEHRISPKEAEDLFRSVDEIVGFASKDTALPVKHEVKRRLTSRDEVEAYVQKHMEEDEDAQRLRRSELVLKKFGLLPR